VNKQNIIKGIKYGTIAGMLGTVATDIVSLVILTFMGVSLPSFFALIGRAFMTLIGAEAANPVWQGLALHYSIGIISGSLLGLLTQRFHRLVFDSYRKGILIGIIVSQVEGNSLFYLMSVIMKIPQSEMVMMYGLCSILHLVWGSCAGLIISYSQQYKIAASRGNTIPIRMSTVSADLTASAGSPD
jgi:hypothetical protein